MKLLDFMQAVDSRVGNGRGCIAVGAVVATFGALSLWSGVGWMLVVPVIVCGAVITAAGIAIDIGGVGYDCHALAVNLRRLI